jgi:PII-like signaling protein
MLTRGEARKVVVHLNEDTSSTENFIFEQVMSFLYEQSVAGATLWRPQEGFGAHHQLHEVTGRSRPVRIEFIDSPEVVESLLPRLCDIVLDGVVEVQDTFVVKAVKREAPL